MANVVEEGCGGDGVAVLGNVTGEMGAQFLEEHVGEVRNAYGVAEA